MRLNPADERSDGRAHSGVIKITEEFRFCCKQEKTILRKNQ